MFEPFDDLIRLVRAPSWPWSCRASTRLEAMPATYETKIEKHPRGVRACARRCPRLLFFARTRTIDTQADARVGGDIECRETQCVRCVEFCGRAAQEAITDQRRHAMHASLQSARLRKQAAIARVVDRTVQKVRIE